VSLQSYHHTIRQEFSVALEVKDLELLTGQLLHDTDDCKPMLFLSWDADGEFPDLGATSLKNIRHFLTSLLIDNTWYDPGLDSRTLFHDLAQILSPISSIMLR
jgi:hypothetical protein